MRLYVLPFDLLRREAPYSFLTRTRDCACGDTAACSSKQVGGGVFWKVAPCAAPICSLPERRATAAEIGVTVSRARKPTGPHGPVRVGRDGKKTQAAELPSGKLAPTNRSDGAIASDVGRQSKVRRMKAFSERVPPALVRRSGGGRGQEAAAAGLPDGGPRVASSNGGDQFLRSRGPLWDPLLGATKVATA